MEIRRLDSRAEDFAQAMQDLLAQSSVSQDEVSTRVADIIGDIRARGDAALLHYAAVLDATEVDDVRQLRLSAETLRAAWEGLDAPTQKALQTAHDNVAEYGERQKLQDWSYTRLDGSILAQQVRPLDSVGIYVPGGKAAYPSSVIMNAVPAKVAGVARIVMVVPTPGGVANPLVLASAYLCGVDEVWTIGGAHAVAALAYGTQSLAAVDKITGPGNRYVAEAKRQVFGQVGIDMIAGPSEVVIIADDTAQADWIAADLFAQAEHDEMAQSILLTSSAQLADRVQKSIAKLLPQQARAAIIERSLAERGALIVCEDIAECIALSNHIAPEHLELMFEQAADYVPHIRHAGAIFVGEHSNEVFGDYCAGTNHVLPTSRSARFASALGVYDFQKRSSVLQLSRAAAGQLSPIAEHLAKGEGLFAHALSAQLRGGDA